MKEKRLIKIVVNDKMQKDYEYFLTEQAGQNFDPQFKPDLTPKEMLEMGIFGGIYMRDCKKEFPADWFDNAKFVEEGSNKRNPELNFCKINASQPLYIWQKKGWINPIDPRGWFQWYCRYYMGRRIKDEDSKQIKRWKAINRHIGQLRKNCRAGDMSCRPKQRQAILHWAYDPRRF